VSGDRGEGIYLRSYLKEFDHLLARPEVTDLYINRPREIWVETLGGDIERHDAPELDTVHLERLSRQIAGASHQAVNRRNPILSATLPDGARVQIVLPPATRGDIAIAIRKHVAADFSIADYEASGALDATMVDSRQTQQEREAVRVLLGERKIAQALCQAVRGRLNILVSGGTSTGKTTFLNALLREVPANERLILIEDTPELRLTHYNSVALIAARSELSESIATADELVSASLRMRPDRIILGELRGREAFAFLRAVNSGHPGSMTTVHADSPAGAIEQIALLVLQGGSQLRREDVRAYVSASIGMFVQLGRIGGKRVVQGLELAP